MGTGRRDGRTATRWISISRLVRVGSRRIRRRARGDEEDRGDESRAHGGGGCLVRIRARVGRRWRPRRRARARRARGGEDDPGMTREEHPREGEGEGEGEEGGEGNVQRAAPARASDGAPRTATHVPAACDHVVPVPHPAGTSRRGKADVRSEARKRLASSRRDARIASSASALSKPRGDVGVAISAVRERSERPSAPPPVDRGRWFHFPPALEECFPRLRRGASIPTDRRPRPRKDGRTNKKRKCFSHVIV